MKAIHANPKEIRKVFTEEYLIPDFQRPYSWDRELCEILWDDLLSFHEDSSDPEERYFLGNIVIHKEAEKFSIIDGQQRLTTLLLLIKAFHQKAGTVEILEKCLKKCDPLTDQVIQELRLESKVVTEDKDQLKDVILNGGNEFPKSRFCKNFNIFQNKLEEWWRSEENSPEALHRLILTLLDRVVILPIHCGSQDDALTIFETINNRGLPLTDADIFKANLHGSTGTDREAFINQWNRISDHEWLFRIHMHVLRASENDSSKESALRSYFLKNSRLQGDWRNVMDSLEKYHLIETEWEPNPEVSIIWAIMESYPNYYWNYPIHVFLHKYGELQNGSFVFPKSKMDKFLVLMKEILRYYFIKGVIYNSVNVVKDTTFKICSLIHAEGDYLSEFAKASQKDLNDFSRKLNDSVHGRYQKGLVLIASYLNIKQDYADYNNLLESKYHIEHILPKKWNDYDGWTSDSWENYINDIGNLVPLEWNLNIKAKNEFFSRKKDKYKDSKVQDVLDLLNLDHWGPEQFKERQKNNIHRLQNFFNGNSIV